jgi:hypothetical protein
MREQMGLEARQRVRDQFTSPRSLLDYQQVIEKILERRGARATV